MVRIENQEAILEVVTRGAEITSFKDKETLLERMWQGDPTYWAGRNPVLFPMVGNTSTKKQIINEHEYAMSNHGIARTAEFTIQSVTDDTITMILTANEDTLKLYPFDFELAVAYKLIGKKVQINYTITNKSNIKMPYSFGLHPAFNCPIEKGEKFEDYHIEFSNNETLKGLLGPFSLNDEKIIPCDYDLYKANPTICFENPKSSSVCLTNGKHGVKVDLVGYRWLAFWTPNAPFLCIEPWHGHGDFIENNLPFEEREGTMILDPGYSYETAYSIEIY